MAAKHRGRNSQNKAKHLFFKADIALFWAPKEVVGPTAWVQRPLESDQTCLLII